MNKNLFDSHDRFDFEFELIKFCLHLVGRMFAGFFKYGFIVAKTNIWFDANTTAEVAQNFFGGRPSTSENELPLDSAIGNLNGKRFFHMV